MANYHVSKAGDDTDAGTELAPFLTLSKLTTSIDTAGDNGFLNRGDTWTGERLIESTDGTNGSRITFDAYGEGLIPALDFQNVNAGNFLGLGHFRGDYITVQNIRFENAGPFTSGTNNGMRAVDFKDCADPKIINCEIETAWRSGIHFGNTSVGALVDGCTVRACGRSEQSAHNWPFAISCSDAVAAVVQNNKVYLNFGEGLGSIESDGGIYQDNEVFGNKQAGIYIDVGADNIVRRNIVYGTTDTNYHRTTGYSGHGLLQNVESFHVAETQLNDNHWSLNLVAFCWSGFRLADQKVGVLQDGLKVEQCSFIDNKDQWQFNYNTPSPANPNLIRNNIMFPITAGTSLSSGTVRSSGITFDYNYWHGGGEDSNLTGSNDPSGTVTLTKTSGWQALATLGDVSGTDFRPESGLSTIDLGYDDYFGVADIAEVGAIIETDTTPPAVGIGGGLGDPGFPGNIKLVLT